MSALGSTPVTENASGNSAARRRVKIPVPQPTSSTLPDGAAVASDVTARTVSAW
jgi:hypothetical protein